MSLVGFQASKIWMFFEKKIVELVWISFPGRNNPLALFFLLSNSLSYGLEESRELQILISWVLLGIQKCKKNLATISFFRF